MKNNVFIVEDISMVRLMLEECMTANGFNVVGSSPSAELAWEEIQQLQVNLVLLDIQLIGEKTGIWLGKQINNYLKIPFIYITANENQQTANEVLETNPVGFIIKPINIIQLITTAKIALNLNQGNAQKQIIIQDGLKSINLAINDIYYLQSEGNYLHIYMKNSHFLVRSSLEDFLEKLNDKKFVRIHQRFAFNIEKKFEYVKDQINILDSQLNVSTKYKKDLKSIIDNN